MKRGEAIRVIKRQGEWTQIIAKPGTAWVYSSLIGSAKDVKRTRENLAKQKKIEEEKRYEKERAEVAKQKKLREETRKQQQADNRVQRFKIWSREIEKGCDSKKAIFRKTWLVGW